MGILRAADRQLSRYACSREYEWQLLTVDDRWFMSHDSYNDFMKEQYVTIVSCDTGATWSLCTMDGNLYVCKLDGIWHTICNYSSSYHKFTIYN